MAQIFGTAAGDSLVGSNGNDFIYGLAGNDSLDGLRGDDKLWVARAMTPFVAGWATTS